MNDKFEARVNATVAAFEKAGIKTDKVSAAKYLREQDRQAQAEAQRQPQVEPDYQQFLNRFGARNGADSRLQGAYSLEKEYGINLLKEDPEFEEFFGDPNKTWSGSYQFVRDYEKALSKKKERTSQQNPQQQANVAGLPSMSGTGKKSTAIPNLMKSSDIYDQAIAEMRNKR